MMLDEIPDGQALRTQVEEALRFLVKNAPIHKAENPAEGESFLRIPSPKGAAIEFFESDGRVDLKFGPSGEAFDFSGDWIDEDEDEDEVDSEDAALDLEQELKEELEDLVNATLDIIEEGLFSARYNEGFAQTGGLFPAEEFETMKTFKAFESMSWNGTYTFGEGAASSRSD